MAKLKKWALCGMICALSLSMVACGEKKVDAETNAQVTASSEVTPESTNTDNITASTVDPKAVIAKVGEKEILREELNLQLGYQQMILLMEYGDAFIESEEGKAYLANMKTYLATNIVNTEVVLQKAEELGITCIESEIQEELKKEKANYDSEDDYKSALEESYMTEEDLRDQIKTSLTVQKMLTYMGEEATVTDEEITEYYNTNIAEFTKRPGAHMYHILVDSEEEANKIKAEYDKGKSFGALAALYGTDGSAKSGGSLDYIEYDSENYDKDFLSSAKTLKEGEVSAPIKTQFGWHIIKVEGIIDKEVTQTLEEAHNTIEEKLLSSKQSEIVSSKLQEWITELGVETFEENING